LHFVEPAAALNQKIHLRAKGRTGFLLVEVGEKGIVLGVEYAPRMQTVGQDSRQSGFAYADRSFDRDRARRLERRRRLRPGRRRIQHDWKL